MESEVKTVNPEKVKKALELLEAARALERDRINWGVDCIYRHIENVDGDWLERWGEDDEEEDDKGESLPSHKGED